MRYFLIDKVTEVTLGESARAVKNVTLTDETVHDHFPDFPVLPGALIVEAMAQLAAFLIEVTTNQGKGVPQRALLVQIRNAKFYHFAEPGDQLDLRVTLGPTLETAAEASGEVFVKDRRIARAQLTFMFKTIDSERVQEQRRYLYGLWTRSLKPAVEVR
jgi:3-hydroxyacyl-[acyl-carrier-protein] dehydratase